MLCPPGLLLRLSAVSLSTGTPPPLPCHLKTAPAYSLRLGQLPGPLLTPSWWVSCAFPVHLSHFTAALKVLVLLDNSR